MPELPDIELYRAALTARVVGRPLGRSRGHPRSSLCSGGRDPTNPGAAMTTQRGLYTAPVFLGTAFLLFGLALIEKFLNLFGGSIPFVSIFPRQVLDWAVTLLIFEIALTLRQFVETRQQGAREHGDAATRGLH